MKKPWYEDVRKGLKEDPNNPTRKIYDWELKETWEDYPFPDYTIAHTYCSVAFDDSGRTFYYRTRNPDIKVGDRVYVPVGRKWEKKVATVVARQVFVGRSVPWPLEKTKYIMGKVE